MTALSSARCNQMRDNARVAGASPEEARMRIKFTVRVAGIRAVAGVVASSSLLAATAALALFDPSKAYIEPPEIAARFPDPDVRYSTPSLATNRADFASHQEAFRFGESLATRTPNTRTTMIGTSQQGRAMQMIVVAHGGIIDGALPTVLIIGQQH